MAFIECRDLHFSYGEETGEVLHGVNLDIERGEFVALLGHNGCGKSTMAKLFNGMLVPTSGTVRVDGIDTAVEDTQLDVRRRVGLVQQNPDNQLVAGIVEEDVAFGPENLGVEPGEIRRRVDAALNEYREHAPHKLSGGQKQRIAIAGVIAMETQCIVLDEPTAMLDPRGRQEVMDTITYLNREKGITIVLITHYMDEAVKAGRVVVMDDGRIQMNGTPHEIFARAEELEAIRLDVPMSVRIALEMKKKGVELSRIPEDMETLAEEVCRLSSHM